MKCVVAMLVGMSVLGIAGCSGSSSSDAGQEIPPMPATTVKAESRDIPDIRVYPATTQAIHEVTIVARVQGILQERSFDEGSNIEKDAPLFLIEPEMYEAATLAAKAQVLGAEVQLGFAREAYTRNEPLALTGAISQQSWDQYVANLEGALAQLEATQASLIQAQLNLGYTEIVAPFAGRIGQRYVDVGNLVGPGLNQSLALVVQLDPMRVVFEPAGTELGDYLKAWPSTKVPVAVTFSTTNGTKTIEGTLDLVDNTLNSGTSTFTARAEFANADETVYPGLFAEAAVTIGVLSGSIVVPPQAVFAELESSYVWTVTKDNTLTRKNVVLGLEFGGVLIVNGLDAETTVLVEGNPYFLKEGAKIDPTLMTIDAFEKKNKDASSSSSKAATSGDTSKTN